MTRADYIECLRVYIEREAEKAFEQLVKAGKPYADFKVCYGLAEWPLVCCLRDDGTEFVFTLRFVPKNIPDLCSRISYLMLSADV